MPATITTAWDIALAVAAELNSAAFMTPPDLDIRPAPTLTAQLIEAAMLPSFETAKVTGLKISVIPVDLDGDLNEVAATRGSDSDQLVVSLGIQDRVNSVGAQEKIDFAARLTYSHNVKQFLSRRPLASVPDAGFRKIEPVLYWHPEHLKVNHVFTSVYRLTYTVSADFG